MKKMLAICLALTLLCALPLSGCSEAPPSAGPSDGGGFAEKPGSESSPDPSPDAPEPDSSPAVPQEEYDTQNLLNMVLESAKAAIELPMTFVDPVTAENCGGVGLTEAAFGDYVTDAYSAKGAIMTIPFEVALFQCNDEQAAAEVKKAVADNYDSNKWVCVHPGQSFVVDAGRFVMLAAVRDEEAGPIQDGFADNFGTAGSVNVFFTFE